MAIRKKLKKDQGICPYCDEIITPQLKKWEKFGSHRHSMYICTNCDKILGASTR
jgi:uncharacterized protein with PIN domain